VATFETASMIRHRFDIHASSVAAVVRAAGGWIFDRAMEGWDIRVTVPCPDDVRPLRILGADVASAGRRTVDIEHLHHDPVICRCSAASWKEPAAQAVLWESGWSAQARNVRVDELEHRLSSAALAFKACALNAAGTESEVRPTESFQIAIACRL